MNRRPANRQLPRYLAWADALRTQSADRCDGNGRLPVPVNTRCLGLRDAFKLALLSDGRFELIKHAQHLHEGGPLGRGGIDSLLNGAKLTSATGLTQPSLELI